MDPKILERNEIKKRTKIEKVLFILVSIMYLYILDQEASKKIQPKKFNLSKVIYKNIMESDVATTS